MVIATYMQYLVALAFVPPMANAIGPMPHFAEVGKFLCVQVEEIPWSLMFVTIGRFILSEDAGLGCFGLA